MKVNLKSCIKLSAQPCESLLICSKLVKTLILQALSSLITHKSPVVLVSSSDLGKIRWTSLFIPAWNRNILSLQSWTSTGQWKMKKKKKEKLGVFVSRPLNPFFHFYSILWAYMPSHTHTHCLSLFIQLSQSSVARHWSLIVSKVCSCRFTGFVDLPSQPV